MGATFYILGINLIGVGALDDAVDFIKTRGFRKPFIVTDQVLVKIGIVEEVKSRLEKHNLEVAVFDKVQPNPTTKNVTDGLVELLAHQADVIVTLGGGSPHDCGKGIALLATNGGDIRDI
jgi:alcohol dehydrogenase